MDELDVEVKSRIDLARVARLTTVGPDGAPHVVPVAFAPLHDGTIVTAVDNKPKTTRSLRRLDNIRNEPRVAMLVDHYEDDWARLWWIRIDGQAAIVDDPPAGAADALASKYEQYVESPPQGPFIVVTPTSVRDWSASPDG